MKPHTADMLRLVADGQTPLGRGRNLAFLDACRADALAHHGEVSVNRVRSLLTHNGELQMSPRAYSAAWSAATGPDKPMRIIPNRWELCSGSSSGNDGRPYRLRRWVGEDS